MSEAASASTRPNLLYILSDQHNPAVTGCYGDPVVRTPHLDALAASGVVFENAYCASPLCGPSRTAMLTGRHPHQNEVWTNNQILSSAIPTYAHALGAAGYRPVLIGHMHAVGPDPFRGFAERLVGDAGSNYVGLGGARPERGVLGPTAGPNRFSLELSGSGQSGYQVYDEHVAATTVDELNRLGAAKREGRAEPFCLSVGFVLPHAPFVARRADYERYEGRVPPPAHPAPFSDALHPFDRWWRERCGIVEVSEAEVMRARTAYWALVDRVDHHVGQILAALRANDLAENTLVVYLSDHGEQVGEHGHWWKQTFYEASVRVPAILSWPGAIPAGQRCGRVVSSLDLTATVLDALDAPPLPDTSGRSLLDLLRRPDASAPWEDEAFSESCMPEGWYQRMIRRGRWKLIYHHGHEPQLFDLETDPHELRDRARDPTGAAVRAELTERVLDGWRPEAIAATMALQRERNDLISAWFRSVQPPELGRGDWRLRAEMSYLDDPSLLESDGRDRRRPALKAPG